MRASVDLLCLKAPDGKLHLGTICSDRKTAESFISWVGSRPPREKWVPLVEQGYTVVEIRIKERR